MKGNSLSKSISTYIIKEDNIKRILINYLLGNGLGGAGGAEKAL